MELYSDKKGSKYTFIEWILTLLINATAIVLATKIFKGFYVDSFIYALITSIVIMILNRLLKPILKILALPITVISLGILYPIVDTIILKLASLVMGNHFIVEGWVIPFFVSIFISIITVLLDAIVTKAVIRSIKWTQY